jgi:hypothetical protein
MKEQAMIESEPKFLNGVFAFTGAGYEKPALLSDKLVYKVPSDKRSQLIYLRAGNSYPEMIYLVLMRDGTPMRYFPIGAQAATHVQLAVVEDIFPDSILEVFFAGPPGVSGFAVIDIGLLEI